MKTWEDYYEILGVSPDATAEQIKEAYLYLVNIFHPDRLMGASESIRKKAEGDLKRVNRAYDTLRDPDERRAYHSEWLRHHIDGKSGYTETTKQSASYTRDKDQLRNYLIEIWGEESARQLLKQFAKYRNIFILPYGFLKKARITKREVITCFPNTMYKWQVGEETEVFNALPPSQYNRLHTDYTSRFNYIPDSFIPLKRSYRIQGSESINTCGSCRGKGLVRCNDCNGRGFVVCEECDGEGIIQEERECPVCGGEGVVVEPHTRRSREDDDDEDQGEIETRCPECHGSGVIEETVRCSVCKGTGERRCDTCKGTGEIHCENCEGTGKVYGAKVITVEFTPIEKPMTRLLKPSYLPDKILQEVNGDEISRELVHTIDNKIERKTVRSIRVFYLEYEYDNRRYAIYKVGAKIKFDKYPKSAKKLFAFSLILSVVIVILLLIGGIISF